MAQLICLLLKQSSFQVKTHSFLKVSLPSYEFYSKQDSLYVLSSSTLFDRIVIQNLESGIVEMTPTEARSYLSTWVQRDDIWWTDKNDIYVKVTVTLYPKAPYNTTPIVSTRTFKPVFVENK